MVDQTKTILPEAIQPERLCQDYDPLPHEAANRALPVRVASDILDTI
ncbi:hypothetical protein HUU05_10175 [candidate division KSB1 bacterium]|nr:hypothetical protein [candidate division KSB1 bacterium]